MFSRLVRLGRSFARAASVGKLVVLAGLWTTMAPAAFADPAPVSAPTPVPVPNPWTGPLPLVNERPLDAIFLHLAQEDPQALAAGRTRLAVQLDVANDLLVPNVGPNGAVVHEDFETQRLKLAWSRGLGHGLEFQAASNLTARDGGIMDGPLEWYHRLVGVSSDAEDDPVGRNNWPRGVDEMLYTDPQGNGVDAGGAFGVGDTTLVLKQQISRGKFVSSLRAALKLPTGSATNVTGSGGTDVGVALNVRRQIARRWAAFGELAGYRYGPSPLPDASPDGIQGGMGFEWRMGRRTSFVIQNDASSRTITTGNAFADRTPVGGSIGLRIRQSPRRLFWCSLTENGDWVEYHVPYVSNIGPDLTLSAGVEFLR